MKKCILEDKICIECGACNICDLDPSKICDNCEQCINTNKDYETILIDEIILED